MLAMPLAIYSDFGLVAILLAIYGHNLYVYIYRWGCEHRTYLGASVRRSRAAERKSSGGTHPVWDIYRYFYFSENLSSGDTNSKWYHTGLYHFQSLGNLPSAAGAARVERRRPTHFT